MGSGSEEVLGEHRQGTQRCGNVSHLIQSWYDNEIGSMFLLLHDKVL